MIESLNAVAKGENLHCLFGCTLGWHLKMHGKEIFLTFNHFLMKVQKKLAGKDFCAEFNHKVCCSHAYRGGGVGVIFDFRIFDF